MKKYDKPVIDALKTLVKQCGSQDGAADKLGITPAYLCDILKGRRPISDRIAKRFGFEWQLVNTSKQQQLT